MTGERNVVSLPREHPQPEPLPAAHPAAASARSRRPFVVASIAVAAVLVVALLAWRQFGPAPASASVLGVSGRISSDDAAVASKVGARIVDVRVREGDTVRAGDVIATLDDEQVRAREDQARAALGQAEARLKSARDQTAVLGAQLQEAELRTAQSKTDAEGRVRQAEADLAAAEAQLAQQRASYQLAEFDQDAYTRLAKTGAVSERQAKQAVSTAEQEAAAVSAAQRRVDSAQGALGTARANLANPGIHAAETATIRRQIAQQLSEISNVAEQTAQSRAQLVEAQANRQDLVVRAPFDGTVVTRAVEPGEVVAPGAAIVTLTDLSKVYLRGFIPEGRIGDVKVGQPARVYLDSSPNQPIDAYVSRIDPEATFTPENTYFRDDRVKQVVGVKLLLKGAVGFAKPGMPADAEILIRGTVWPAAGRQS